MSAVAQGGSRSSSKPADTMSPRSTSSPGAVAVCSERGVRDVQLRSILQIDQTMGRFDRIAMFGNNLGLVANPAQGARLLRRFTKILAPGGAVIAVTLDPFGTSDPVHLAYQKRNRDRGRAGGQIRLRIRYRTLCDAVVRLPVPLRR